MSVSPRRRQEIIDALRRGTVPHSSLDAFAVGLDRLEPAFQEELLGVKAGGAAFKACRGEYGCGKTFLARWLADRARRLGFATSEVQVSETETPLHRLETVYRRLCERLATADASQGALRNLIDGWFYALEQDALAEGGDLGERDVLAHTDRLMEQRLAKAAAPPRPSRALRSCKAQVAGERGAGPCCLAGRPAQPRRPSGRRASRGIDHFGALTSSGAADGHPLRRCRPAGRAGRVETIQRVRRRAGGGHALGS